MTEVWKRKRATRFPWGTPLKKEGTDKWERAKNGDPFRRRVDLKRRCGKGKVSGRPPGRLPLWMLGLSPNRSSVKEESRCHSLEQPAERQLQTRCPRYDGHAWSAMAKSQWPKTTTIPTITIPHPHAFAISRWCNEVRGTRYLDSGKWKRKIQRKWEKLEEDYCFW